MAGPLSEIQLQVPQTPHDEPQRLRALAGLSLLDTPPEERFDRITALAGAFFGTPIALVSLVDGDRQWFKSRVGLEATETPRDVSFCGHTILGEGAFVVEDATADPRFEDNPLVTGDPVVRFYAGQPIKAPGGEAVGTLCVIDHVARPFSEADGTALAAFGALVESQLAAVELAQAVAERRAGEQKFRSIFEYAPTGIAIVDLEGADAGRYRDVNPALCRMVGRTRAELLKMRFLDLDHPDDRAGSAVAVERLLELGHLRPSREKRYLHSDGHDLWVAVHASLFEGVRSGPRQAVVHVEDITLRRRAEAELTRKALHDPLTGLPNRMLFTDHLELALAELDREPGFVSVMFVDLDDFKAVNDTYGHPFGDRVLAEAAQRLRRVMRQSDTLARYGGDEFAAVCRALSGPAEAADIGHRLASAMSPPIVVDHVAVELGASVGVAVTTRPDHEIAALLRDADAAMYAAKGPA